MVKTPTMTYDLWTWMNILQCGCKIKLLSMAHINHINNIKIYQEFLRESLVGGFNHLEKY